MFLSGVITHTHYIILGDMLNASVWVDHPYLLKKINILKKGPTRNKIVQGAL